MLQTSFEDVVKRVLPSVVQITTSSGLGSGVVYDRQGDLVTNAHVTGNDQTFQVTLPSGGPALSASLVSAYQPDDLAVIRPHNPPPSLTPAKFGDSNALVGGEIVLAMGNPLGFSGSVTNGIVSGTGRTVTEPPESSGPGATIPDAVQTSAAINPGNSGGALVDLSGQVVGVPTLAAVDPQLNGSAAPGIGFAIPANTVTDIAGQIVHSGRVVDSHRAELGVAVSTVVNASGQPAGAGVVRLTPGGPADKAGIRAGDIITAINGTAIADSNALAGALAAAKPGDTVTVNVRHPDGSTADVHAVLGELPG
ncbi:S1C family serine protease [Amycolatopsis pigmentata]|uniref:S1C family serine protease n=1 Tax=Amycolatopsis pigmentata TaxID=450801 RepID=A0ABW5FZ40_9PSEU